MRQEEQSQVEHLKSLGDVALPWKRQTSSSPLQSVFLCLLVYGRCPEATRSWNIKLCHGGSGQLWALSCSGSLPGVEVAAGMQVWKKAPQLIFWDKQPLAPSEAEEKLWSLYFWDHVLHRMLAFDWLQSSTGENHELKQFLLAVTEGAETEKLKLKAAKLKVTTGWKNMLK